MSNEKDDVSRDVSNTTNVITQIMMAVGCPSDHRDFIDGLISISKGTHEVEVSDEHLADAIRTDAADVVKATKQKWTSRKRDRLEAWQAKSGIVLVDCQHGDKDWILKTVTKSRYKLPILEYAGDVLNSARQNEDLWKQNPDLAIQNAVAQLVNELKYKPRYTPRQPKKTRDDYREVMKKIHSAQTNLENAKKLLDKNDEGIYYNDEDSIKELEDLIAWLRGRVGY